MYLQKADMIPGLLFEKAPQQPEGRMLEEGRLERQKAAPFGECED